MRSEPEPPRRHGALARLAHTDQRHACPLSAPGNGAVRCPGSPGVRAPGESGKASCLDASGWRVGSDSCRSGYSGSVSLGELLGVDVSQSDGDSATATLVVDERHLNAGGTVHGGAIATLVDVTMGAAVFAGNDDDERPVTIEMKVNYLEAGEPGG